MDLDKTDMGILKLLQEEGRLNNAEIAKRVFFISSGLLEAT